MNSFPEFESVDFYNKDAASYDIERFSNIQGSIIDQIQKKIVNGVFGSNKNKLVLDLGCGTGRFSIELERHGLQIVSVDPSLLMLKEITKKIKKDDNITLIQGIAHQLPFKDSSFDGCICINVMDHIKEPQIIFSEVSRILKKDGHFLFNFSNYYSFYLPFAIYINYSKKSLLNDVFTEWHKYSRIRDYLNDTRIKIEKIYGHLLFPKKEIPNGFLKLFYIANKFVSNSKLKYFSGSIYVVSKKG